MIFSDTTPVNTGQKNKVVVQLQRQFEQKRLEKPQFIGCQHHILDLILRNVMDQFFPTKSKSPNINHNFIEDLLKGCDELQKNNSNTETLKKGSNL